MNWEFDKVKHADDTRLFLDGSEKPSNSALHLIGQFSKYPGLKPNIDKTKCIWIGANKNSEVRLCPDHKLGWKQEPFMLLCIRFSVDLQDMLATNFDDKITSLYVCLTQIV